MPSAIKGLILGLAMSLGGHKSSKVRELGGAVKGAPARVDDPLDIHPLLKKAFIEKNYLSKIISKHEYKKGLSEIIPAPENKFKEIIKIPPSTHDSPMAEFSSHGYALGTSFSMPMMAMHGSMHSASYSGETDLSDFLSFVPRNKDEEIRTLLKVAMQIRGRYHEPLADLTEDIRCFKEGLTDQTKLEDNKKTFLTKLNTQNPSPLLANLFSTAFDFHAANSDPLGIYLAKYCALELAKLDPPEALLRNYVKAINEGYVSGIKESSRLLAETVAHAAEIKLIRSTSESEKDEAKKLIQKITLADTVPYSYEDTRAAKVYAQTLTVQARIFDLFHGFSALTFDARSPFDRTPPLLGRFGHDAATKCKPVYGKDREGFPGKGFLISGIIPEKVFVPDKGAKMEGLDPFHAYKKAWDYLKDDFDTLQNAHFLFTRGLMAVSVAGDEKYIIDGVHYSYVVLNDHHHNYKHKQGIASAYLIPTKVLQDKIKGTTSDFEDYPSFPKDIEDINEKELTLPDLIKASEGVGAKVFNIGSGTNLGGGLCNSDPLDSTPLFGWENALRKRGHTTDIWDHVHKSHIRDRYESRLQNNAELETLMEPFRKRHNEIYTVVNSYQNLFDLFRLSLTRWHKGETVGDAVQANDADLFDAELTENQELQAGDDASRNPAALKMLAEAFKWHDSGKEKGVTEWGAYPVLALVPALDYWTIPQSPFTLDTFDMTLRVGDETVSLLKFESGIGDFDIEEIWHSLVTPHLQGEVDLRFYHREDVGYVK